MDALRMHKQCCFLDKYTQPAVIVFKILHCFFRHFAHLLSSVFRAVASSCLDCQSVCFVGMLKVGNLWCLQTMILLLSLRLLPALLRGSASSFLVSSVLWLMPRLVSFMLSHRVPCPFPKARALWWSFGWVLLNSVIWNRSPMENTKYWTIRQQHFVVSAGVTSHGSSGNALSGAVVSRTAWQPLEQGWILCIWVLSAALNFSKNLWNLKGSGQYFYGEWLHCAQEISFSAGPLNEKLKPACDAKRWVFNKMKACNLNCKHSSVACFPTCCCLIHSHANKHKTTPARKAERVMPIKWKKTSPLCTTCILKFSSDLQVNWFILP